MKLKNTIFIGLAAIAVTAVAGWNVYLATQSNNEMTDLMLANVEALAYRESGSIKDCPGGSCSYSDAFLNCTACCPQGKNPKCSSWGCTCE
jgi:hypothetical protein